MKIFLQPYIQELKNKVLEIAQINNIIAADCFKLALDISAKTHKTISQTTIKRVYGFAQARYAPSTFTLSALAQYCDYKSWSDFIEQMDKQKDNSDQRINWHDIALSAHNITRFTIQANKHKSGVSYLHTIDRQAINEHIQQFLHHEATGCVISAPSGTGKTIGITRWVANQLAKNHSQEQKNIFLFVNSSSLFFATGFGFSSNKWLTHLLNLPQQQHFDEFILNYEKKAPGDFYIIIDDFNNNLINKHLFDMVFKQLIDMITFLSNYPWIKVIITLRPSTWQKYGHFIENHQEISKHWFTNFTNSQRFSATNLYPFTPQEVQQLINKISNKSYEKTTYNQKYFSVISLPLHFQYYYQLKGKTITLDTLNPADEYAIVSTYLHKTILKGASAAEKQIILSELLPLVNFLGKCAFINKKEVYHIIKENKNVYNELLHTGVIYEHQEEKGTWATYQIRFKSLVIATYFMAQNIFDLHEGKADKSLIDWLENNNYTEVVNLALLKWFIIFSLESGDSLIFNHIQDLNIMEPHQTSLVLFTCNILDYIVRSDPNMVTILNQTFASSAFINIAFDHILMETEYQQALKKLLRYQISTQHKILLHTSLAFYELVYLKYEDASKHIEILKSIPNEFYADFSLNPLSIIENIHHYYRYNIFRQNVFSEIQRTF